MLKEGLFVTVVGLAVVFATLWLLSGVLSAMKLFSGVESKRESASEAQSTPVDELVVEEKLVAGQDDMELIAVISAAVAVAMKRETAAIRVASIRRVVDTNHGWAAAGRIDVINSRI